jgi:adenylate cyclase
MWRRIINRAIDLASSIGADPRDSADLRVRKSLLVLVTILVIPPGLIWSTLYWAAGASLAALIPFAYIGFSMVLIVVFHRTRDFVLLRRTYLVAWLVTPFALGVVLGGLVASSGVILWSLIAPLGAISVGNPRRAWPWIVAFIALVLVTTPLADLTRLEPSPLPANLVLAFMALNIGTVSMVAFIVLAVFARQREVAQERADGLLLNILPAEIAERLKTERGRIAESYEDVTVLFADVVDFTPMSAQLAPSEVVGMLDRLFTDFDALVDRHEVEKIKTIGDAYMVAAGVPSPRSDHAQVICRLALEMRAAAARHRRGDGTPIQLRIGLSSGPVVAGVIGRRKFIYDLWGDTVNLASRMESHGVPDRIQVAEPTYERIRDSFRLEPRGSIEVKGKGRVRTWYLVGAGGTDPLAATT